MCIFHSKYIIHRFLNSFFSYMLGASGPLYFLFLVKVHYMEAVVISQLVTYTVSIALVAPRRSSSFSRVSLVSTQKHVFACALPRHQRRLTSASHQATISLHVQVLLPTLHLPFSLSYHNPLTTSTFLTLAYADREREQPVGPHQGLAKM